VVSIDGCIRVHFVTSQMTSEQIFFFLFVLRSYVVAVMIKLSRSYDLEMIINVSEQYILLLCICYMEEWFWHLSASLFRIFVMGNWSGGHVVSGEWDKYTEFSDMIQCVGWCLVRHLVWHGKWSYSEQKVAFLIRCSWSSKTVIIF
jgi:hypothetical protein